MLVLRGLSEWMERGEWMNDGFRVGREAKGTCCYLLLLLLLLPPPSLHLQEDCSSGADDDALVVCWLFVSFSPCFSAAPPKRILMEWGGEGPEWQLSHAFLFCAWQNLIWAQHLVHYTVEPLSQLSTLAEKLRPNFKIKRYAFFKGGMHFLFLFFLVSTPDVLNVIPNGRFLLKPGRQRCINWV